jgi:hypothetical protein
MGHVRDQLVNIFKQWRRQQFADALAVSEYLRDAFVRDQNIYFQWLLCTTKGENNGNEESIKLKIP